MKNKPKATWISHVDLTATQQTQQQTRWLVRAEKSRANFSEKTAPVGFWGEISLCRKLTLLAFASYVIEQWLMYWERFIFSRDFSFLALCVIRAIRGKTMTYIWFAFKTVHSVLHVLENKGAQQTQLVDPILAYCWASLADGGATVGQYWISKIRSAYCVFRIGGTLLAMVDCWHSNQARLLITAAISVIHLTHFLTTRLILSAKLSKNKIISPIFLVRL